MERWDVTPNDEAHRLVEGGVPSETSAFATDAKIVFGVDDVYLAEFCWGSEVDGLWPFVDDYLAISDGYCEHKAQVFWGKFYVLNAVFKE